jgi:hypothetical protein
LKFEIVRAKIEIGVCRAVPIVDRTKFQGYVHKALKGVSEQLLSGHAVFSVKESPKSTRGTGLFKFAKVAN